MMYVTNDAGDIVSVQDGARQLPIDPKSFGWTPKTEQADPGEGRRPLDALLAIPGFSVTIVDLQAFVPGPRPKRSVPWMKWADGAAPPVALMSRGGMDGPLKGNGCTLTYYDRITEAVGNVARRLPAMPERSPMVIYDFVGGRRIAIDYAAPPVAPGGHGRVYIIDDGIGIKIGWTGGLVAKRMGDLQVGNSRSLVLIAVIEGASPEVEAQLQQAVAQHHLSGEWYSRGPLMIQAAEKRGILPWLESHLGEGWDITVHPPYA